MGARKMMASMSSKKGTHAARYHEAFVSLKPTTTAREGLTHERCPPTSYTSQSRPRTLSAHAKQHQPLPQRAHRSTEMSLTVPEREPMFRHAQRLYPRPHDIICPTKQKAKPSAPIPKIPNSPTKLAHHPKARTSPPPPSPTRPRRTRSSPSASPSTRPRSP